MRPAYRVVLLVVVLLIGLSAFTVSPVRAECGVYHTVIAGQNLFRISLKYGVNMYTIAAANGIANVNRIYAGQVLYIPCAGSVPVIQPPQPVYPIYQPQPVYPVYPPYPAFPTNPYLPAYPILGAVDCTGFRATSPVDGFPNGTITFYWDSPRSGQVDTYQVYVLNDKGVFVGSFTAGGFVTRLNGDVSRNSIGPGVNFSWYVVALVGGKEVCRSQRVSLRREWSGDLTSG